MFVKICGTTNVEDARLAVGLGADALGFIFAPSKRRVTVEQAAAMTRELPKYVDRVGIFTKPDAEDIARVVRGAGLRAVQMHWRYDPTVVEAVRGAVGNGVALWQVVGIETAPDEERAADAAAAVALRGALSDRGVAVVLLDSMRAGASGGLGVRLPWERAGEVLRIGCHNAALWQEPQIVLAGGLEPENVNEAVETLRPWGVDVVSGVEARAGVKDPERLRAFFGAVREAEARVPGTED